MILTIMIEDDLIEHAARWFPALVLVHHVCAQFLQRERVRDGFGGRLRGNSALSPSLQFVRLYFGLYISILCSNRARVSIPEW